MSPDRIQHNTHPVGQFTNEERISRKMLSTSEAVGSLGLGTIEELAENVEIPQTKITQPFDSARSSRDVKEPKRPLPGQHDASALFSKQAESFLHLGQILRRG